MTPTSQPSYGWTLDSGNPSRPDRGARWALGSPLRGLPAHRGGHARHGASGRDGQVSLGALRRPASDAGRYRSGQSGRLGHRGPSRTTPMTVEGNTGKP